MLPACVLCFLLMDTDARSLQARALLEEVGDSRATRVAELEQRRASLKRDQSNISREIKKENKKRQRLLEKSRGLSELDLLTIISTRAATKAKSKAKASAASAS